MRRIGLTQVFSRILGALLVLSAVFAGGVARADEVTATGSIYSFSSPGDLYGPWSIRTLKYQLDRGKDIPSVTLLDRNDNDRPTGSSAQAIYLDDYHTWSQRFYTYAQVSFGKGTISPYRMAYLEGDVKLTPEQNVVMGFGGATMQNPDGTSTQLASIGPSLYMGRMVYTLRFLPSDTNGVHAAATQFVAEYSDIGRNQVTLSLLNGSQPSVLVGFPPSFATFQRLFEANLMVKHWLRRDFGIIVGGTFGNHFDRSTGANIYDQQGITIGLFFGNAVGSALAHR